MIRPEPGENRTGTHFQRKLLCETTVRSPSGHSVDCQFFETLDSETDETLNGVAYDVVHLSCRSHILTSVYAIESLMEHLI